MQDDQGPGEPSGDRSFFAVALAQRACRRFSDQPVDDELLERCLEVAVHAPSAENRQPWRFVVVRDPAVRGTIAELTRRAWREGGRRYSEGRLAPRLMAAVDDGAESGMGTAPVIVVVCGDTDLGLEATLPASVYPAVQNLLLATTALGLGSAMTTLATVYAGDLRRLLELPDLRTADGGRSHRVARAATRPPAPATALRAGASRWLRLRLVTAR